MNDYKTAFLLTVVIIFQITIADFFTIKGISPDFILIFLIFFSFKSNRTSSTVIGFTGGLFQDFLGSGFIGVSSLSKSLTGFFVNLYSEKSKIRKDILFYWMLFFGCLFHDVIFFMIYTMGTNLNFFEMLFRYSLPTTIYNFLLGGLIYFAINK